MRFIVFLWGICFSTISWCSNHALSIEISGLNSEEKKRVLENLSIKDFKNMSKNRLESYNQLTFEEIKTILESIGYYHAHIQNKLITTDKKSTIYYEIDPGPPVLIQSVNIKILGEGQHHPELQSLIKHASLTKGARLNHQNYETFKQSLLAKALQLGYLEAAFNINKIYLNLHQNQANISLELFTGTQYKIGDIQFVEPPYPIDYLKRYILVTRGTPYTTDKLLSLQQAFINSDLFTKVRIDPQLNATKNFLVPIKIQLIPKPHNKYTASLGFGTDTGPRVMLGWERKRVTYPGHRINLGLKSSKRYNQANLQYSIPGKQPITDKIVFGNQISEEKLIDKKYSLQNKLGITHLQKRGEMEQLVGVDYLTAIFRTLPSEPKKHSHFLLPGISYTWNTLQKEALLPQGTFITLSTRGGLQSLLSSTSLFRGEIRAKWGLAWGEFTRIIIRTDLGAIAASNFSEVPISLRFFTGGDQTVRGFGYNTLGPKETDASGRIVVVGGRYLFIGSLELERIIYKNIGAAIFVDSGNAMNDWGARLMTSAGFGIRYATPLGPLRLDIAKPIIKGKHKPRLHLTFGIDL